MALRTFDTTVVFLLKQKCMKFVNAILFGHILTKDVFILFWEIFYWLK